ncbi:MAG TPA: 50S ribosomal protein L9 [Candidatus Paceibacterota bacterium]|jgi:large subunit ribosomal protein L9|nr:50S ribosomal protein L9 [Candidatus Paceibacterota bacterium]
MKIILIKDVGGVGRHGEVKDVSDGYALNHLIPRGLAEQATPEKIKAHEAAVQKEGETRAKEQEALVGNIQSLEGARIEIAARATEKGGLFKSLGATDILKGILEQKKVDVPVEAISLEKPIKEVGDHELELKIAGAKARLTVAVKKAD